jgi:hypothetical protein
MKKKQPLVTTKEVLELKNTKALLAYLNKLQRCEESFDLSDMDVNLDLIDDEKIYFKQTDKWRIAFKNVKSLLEKSEHIDKKSSKY